MRDLTKEESQHVYGAGADYSHQARVVKVEHFDRKNKSSKRHITFKKNTQNKKTYY